jgi:hypothetical protein
MTEQRLSWRKDKEEARKRSKDIRRKTQARHKKTQNCVE